MGPLPGRIQQSHRRAMEQVPKRKNLRRDLRPLAQVSRHAIPSHHRHGPQRQIGLARNGVQGLRKEWGDWCNVIGAGFGKRPTSTTGSSYADAFVWVKPGGESDGTSDTSATRYDSFCGKEDAFKPSPEAGTWNQAYFEQLLKNANPAF